MYEVWVRPNRRAILFGAAVPLVSVVVGLWMAARLAEGAVWVLWLGVLLAGFGAVCAVLILWQLRLPRVAYRGGEVLFYLQSGTPIAVPLELVEAFFLGQGPLMVKGAPQGREAVNLVARISQRDPNYERRDVKPALGSWCESYVTMRGMWCEPLNGELIRRLNRRLREAGEELAGVAGQAGK
jgi:hypothetical protein